MLKRYGIMLHLEYSGISYVLSIVFSHLLTPQPCISGLTKQTCMLFFQMYELNVFERDACVSGVAHMCSIWMLYQWH